MFLYDEWRAEICWKKREIGGARLSAAMDRYGRANSEDGGIFRRWGSKQDHEEDVNVH